MFLAGTGIFFLLEQVTLIKESQGSALMGYFTSVFITVCVWEGNLLIAKWMNLKFPWHQSPGKHILFHLPASLVFSSATIFLCMLGFDKFVCTISSAHSRQFMRAAITIGTLVSVIILSVKVSLVFFRNWKSSLVEVEKYKAETLQAQLQNLKDQVDPHFMFNSLSVLSSLVYKDQDKAVDFINQLSKVHRYLLDSSGSELVNLRDELSFVESYTYLLQIRFDKNLLVDFDIAEEFYSYMVPPMSLQILIENAIKHNEVSEELPLHIQIKVTEHKLQVVNNLQRRNDSGIGTKKGLRNIKDRYKFFTEHEVEIYETQSYFTAKIPLLTAR